MTDRREGFGRRYEDQRWERIEDKLDFMNREIETLKMALVGSDILTPEKGLLARVNRLESNDVERVGRRAMIATLVGSLLLFMGTLWSASVANSDKFIQFFRWMRQ